MSRPFAVTLIEPGILGRLWAWLCAVGLVIDRHRPRLPQARFLYDLRRSPGFIQGMGPCEGPTSKDEPDKKYPVAAIDAERWFVVDLDGLNLEKAEDAELLRFMASPDLAARWRADLGSVEAARDRCRAANVREPDYRFFWLDALIETDSGAQLFFEADKAAKVGEQGDPRHAFWSGRRGFFPVRLVHKRNTWLARRMRFVTPAGERLAQHFNRAAEVAAKMTREERDAAPFLDDPWRTT